jgi:hypothetical protein
MHYLCKQWKEYAKAMLPFLHVAERDGWHHLITSDESRFFLNTSPRCTWTLSRDNMVTRPRFDIQSNEFIFMTMWNSSDFYVVKKPQNNAKMNSDYFVTSILIRFEQEIFPRGRAPHQKWLAIHLDNCSIHISRASTDWLEEYDMHRMLHSLYSPDLTSNDFYLFLTVKEKLERIQVADDDQFFESLQAILRGSIEKNWIRYFRLGYGGFKK